MEALMDYHTSEIVSSINNLDSLLNFVSNDFTCDINNKYNNFKIATNALLKKDSIILDHFKDFIKNNITLVISYSNLINIIDHVNNYSNNENKAFKFCFLLWMYIHH